MNSILTVVIREHPPCPQDPEEDSGFYGLMLYRKGCLRISRLDIVGVISFGMLLSTMLNVLHFIMASVISERAVLSYHVAELHT